MRTSTRSEKYVESLLAWQMCVGCSQVKSKRLNEYRGDRLQSSKKKEKSWSGSNNERMIYEAIHTHRALLTVHWVRWTAKPTEIKTILTERSIFHLPSRSLAESHSRAFRSPSSLSPLFQHEVHFSYSCGKKRIWIIFVEWKRVQNRLLHFLLDIDARVAAGRRMYCNREKRFNILRLQ